MRKRRERKEIVAISVIIVFFIVVIYLSYLFVNNSSLLKKDNNLNDHEEVSEENKINFLKSNIVNDSKSEETPKKKYHLSLIMGGDSLIHSAVYSDALKDGKYDFKPMLEKIKPIIKKYDLAYYNQETILGGSELGLSTYPRFNSPYEVGDAFIDAGFNVVSLANNHTLDRGEKAIINSRKYWNVKNVMVNGSATSVSEKNNIDIREKNGITYALLSYTTSTNGISRSNDYYVNWYSEKNVKNDIEKIRDKVDLLMVAMHWGIEYNTSVSNNQKEIAEYLSSLGVDIVIGCHPHVIEPAEYIDNTFVIYSLGNFISAQRTKEQLSGLLMSVDVEKTVDTKTDEKSLEVKNPTAEFIYTYSDRSSGYRKAFKIYPYTMLNDDMLKDYKTMYNTLKKRVTSLDPSIRVVEIAR